MRNKGNPLLVGYWKIAEMDEGNSADIDLVVYGFIEFEMDGRLVGGADWLDAP